MSQRRRRRERRFHPGMEVRIAKDCRPESEMALRVLRGEKGNATGAVAVYLGRYDWPNTKRRFTGSRDHGNPLMRLPDGSYIWGLECWWIPEREAQLAHNGVLKNACVGNDKEVAAIWKMTAEQWGQVSKKTDELRMSLEHLCETLAKK